MTQNANRPAPPPSQPLDKWTLNGMTWDERKAAKAARAEFLKAEKAAGAAHARTCQICGRQIFAETGVIAHHGYQRPAGMGYQTTSCEGARYPSFEVSRDRLASYIESAKLALVLMASHLSDLRAEAVPFRAAWRAESSGFGRNRSDETAFVTRDGWAALVAAQPRILWGRPGYKFDDLKARAIASQERDIEALRQHVVDQQARFDSWVQVEGPAEVSPAPAVKS